MQYHETDYDYVRRLAAEHNKFAFYDGSAFNVEAAKSNNEQKLQWRETIGSFSLGIGTAPTDYRGQVWNPKDTSRITGEAGRSSLRAALSPGLCSRSRRVILASLSVARSPGRTPWPAENGRQSMPRTF